MQPQFAMNTGGSGGPYVPSSPNAGLAGGYPYQGQQPGGGQMYNPPLQEQPPMPELGGVHVVGSPENRAELK